MGLAGLTIAVNGATGFLGSHLALELLARGPHVRAVIRNLAKGTWLEDEAIALHAGVDAIVSNEGQFRLHRPVVEGLRDVLG